MWVFNVYQMRVHIFYLKKTMIQQSVMRIIHVSGLLKTGLKPHIHPFSALCKTLMNISQPRTEMEMKMQMKMRMKMKMQMKMQMKM